MFSIITEKKTERCNQRATQKSGLNHTASVHISQALLPAGTPQEGTQASSDLCDSPASK